jgi:uncharacterized protein YjbI with pentapeptide repeats
MYADLQGANLSNATLGLSKNYLELHQKGFFRAGARLTFANLENADLSNVNLNAVILSGARGLTQAQLDKACGADVVLNSPLTVKPCK